MNRSKAVRFQTDKEVDMEMKEKIGAVEFIKQTANVSHTENGAKGYATTHRPLLDLNFNVSKLRFLSNDEIIDMFIDAYVDDKEHSIKWLFFLRDILDGLGERRSFRVILKYLADRNSAVAIKLLPFVKEYGRYDDYLILLESSIKNEVIKYLKNELDTDLIKIEKGLPISLLGKWLPSINTSSKETVKYAKKLAKGFGMSDKEYRKTLSLLRSCSNVLEVKLSKNKWIDVDYETVPSKANLKYEKAFMRHDEERRAKFICDAFEKNGKINYKTIMPYEIVTMFKDNGCYRGFKDNLLGELLWKKLSGEKLKNEFGFEDCIVVADGSGSMELRVNNKTSNLDICNSLAIYFAEKLKSVFKDTVITFSCNPRIVDLKNCKTLKEKLTRLYRYDECANTNIEAVFDLLLNMAVSNKVPTNEIPKQILIISDMEFDNCAESNNGNYINTSNTTLFDAIKSRYEDAGYEMPRLIFWNLCGRTGTIPMLENENGLVLMSGFSQNTAKVAMTKEKKDPYKSLLEVLDKDRYNIIWEAVKNVA